MNPDTVIGVCAEAVRSGELNDLEALMILLLLVSAGSESTTSLIGTGVSILAEDKALQERLRANPSLVETFVKEACRVDPLFEGTTAA
jgi:cytochrome P450 family 144